MTLQIAGLAPVPGQPGLFYGPRNSCGTTKGCGTVAFFAPLGDLPERRDAVLEAVCPPEASGLFAGLAGLLGLEAEPTPRVRDFVNVVDFSWYAMSAADKKKFGSPERWWKAFGKDNRVSSRASFAAIQAEKPNATPKEAQQWWVSIGKNSRQRLRAKYTKGYDDNVFDDIAKVAKKGVDLYTLRPLTKHIPGVRDAQKALAKVYSIPIDAATAIVKGDRIDKVALKQFRTALASAKTLAPYVQTVISFVPGIGTGLSAGIGGALALAEGKRIDEAFLSAMRSAVPGGAIAQAAFDVTTAVVQGKPVEAVVLNALPVEPGAKEALIRGAAAARALAEGKRVDQVVLDQALKALPPAAQKAAQVGVAVAQAKNIQQGVSKVAGVVLPKVADAFPKGVVPKMPDVAKLAKQGSTFARQLPFKRKPSTAAISDAMRKVSSNATRVFGGKPAPTPQRPLFARQQTAKSVTKKKKTASNKELVALQKQLNTLLAKERKEDKTQAAKLRKLQDELNKTKQAAAVQDAVQKAVQEALARQAATQPPQYAQPSMYQPFPGYAPQFAPQALPMIPQQPPVYASQALPQLSPEDYAAMQLPTSLNALHGVLV